MNIDVSVKCILDLDDYKIVNTCIYEAARNNDMTDDGIKNILTEAHESIEQKIQVAFDKGRNYEKLLAL